jgi:hypothetical protein
LEEVTIATMPTVKVNRVTHHQPMHPSAQIPAMGLRHQMKMVCHEHKSHRRHLVTAAGALQQLQKLNSIAIVSEYLLPHIAPGAEMINGVLKFNPQRASHSLSSHRRTQMSNI